MAAARAQHALDVALPLVLAEAAAAAEGPLLAGQVVLFQLSGLEEARHCGIMVSPERFIHAQEKLGVVEANLTPAWMKRVSGRFWFP